MNKDTSNFFINVSNGWFWFVNFTSNRVWRLQMTVFINISYWVITFRNNFICLTISCLDDIWLFTFFSCIIWCVIWWFRCILTRFLDFVTFRIYISDNNFTFFWCFFHFVYIRYILIFFSYFTSCCIWWCKVSLVINLTYCVSSCWNQFISLTLELDCLWTVIDYCIVVFTYWLFFFICYKCFDCVTFSVFIVNVNITFRLDKVIVHISWRFNRSWNWVVVWEWRVTFQLCISNASIWLSYLRFCNNISITSCDQVPSVVSFTSRSQWRIWSTCKWFVKCFSNLGFVMS